MIEKKLTFKNSKGNRLCGVLSNPTDSKEKPIILLCHGLSTGKDGRTYIRLEKILNKNKISTFRFDFYGHGESEGKFENVTISEAIEDIKSGLRLLKEKGYKKIGLFASSFSGIASMIIASETDYLFVYALKSPVSNYEEKYLNSKELKKWKERGYKTYMRWDEKEIKLKYNFFKDAVKYNGYEIARKIKIPTIIVHGEDDKTVPVEQSKKIANLIPNCRLEILEDTDHQYSKKEKFEKMLKLISDFIIEKSKSE